MQDFDVFNGDADGICALLQLRQIEPRDAILVTGVKRDISLLDRVSAGPGDRVTVLDIAVEKNQPALDRLLGNGVDVFYVDHHNPGTLPTAPGLESVINTSPEVCTSALVNGYLSGAAAEWAVVGCFGDNLDSTAERLAATLESKPDLAMWRELGILMNYNAYGAQVTDLHFPPDELFRRLLPHATPDACFHDEPEIFGVLRTGYREDMDRSRDADRLLDEPSVAIIALPDEAWARRVSGVLGNQLTQEHPDRAHAILTEREGGYLVSVRAPLNRRTGADDVCRSFETGGGRSAAAGINHLPESDVARFIQVFRTQYEQQA